MPSASHALCCALLVHSTTAAAADNSLLSLLFARFRPPPSGTAPRPNNVCYSLPGPPEAAHVSCAGGTQTAVRIVADVDASVDYASIELRRNDTAGPPNLHFTMSAHAGKLDGWVMGLSARGAYTVAVRTHRAGCAEDAGNGTWSELVSLVGTCDTLSEDSAAVEDDAGPRAGAFEARTRWLEVYRIAENNRSLPDFLDNHDSGDMAGDGALLPLTDKLT